VQRRVVSSGLQDKYLILKAAGPGRLLLQKYLLNTPPAANNWPHAEYRLRLVRSVTRLCNKHGHQKTEQAVHLGDRIGLAPRKQNRSGPQEREQAWPSEDRTGLAPRSQNGPSSRKTRNKLTLRSQNRPNPRRPKQAWSSGGLSRPGLQ
jgi:hypothetical protein